MYKRQDLCDIVILDGTPNELVTDSLILTRLVDSTVIVTASKETKKENLKRAIANIQNVGGKIAGVVVNKIPVSAKKYQQSYYYGSNEMMKARNDMKKAMNRNRKNNLIKQVQNNKTNTTQETHIQKNENNNKAENSELQRNIEVANNEISLEKTNDILKQINEYIDKEKKNLE